MTQLSKGIALLIAVTCFVWLAVLWHWQSTQRDMSVRDIAVYLVALPLTVFALALLARWAWSGAATSLASKAPSAAVTDAGKTGAAPAAEDHEPVTSTALLATGLCTVAGTGVEALIAACKVGQPRPAIDKELRDGDGLPVMAVRMRDLDIDALDLEPLEAAMRAESSAWTASTWPDEHKRALAGLQSALDDLLVQWPEPLGAADQDVGRVSADKPVLHVLSAWPRHWSEADVAVGTRWLARYLEASEPRWATVRFQMPQTDGLHAWSTAERTLRALAREQRSDRLLVTACHSHIGSSSIDRLERAGQLFTARTPKQPIPGEAAAALLLGPSSSLATASEPGIGVNAAETSGSVRLHRAAVGRRESGAARRPARTATQDCVRQALAAGSFTEDGIASVVHDADQHTARAGEALTALLSELPHLSAAEDAIQTGALTGQTGAVAPLLAVALAAHQARSSNLPCMALSVDDESLRFALVASPAHHVSDAPPGLRDDAQGS